MNEGLPFLFKENPFEDFLHSYTVSQLRSSDNAEMESGSQHELVARYIFIPCVYKDTSS